MDIIILAGGFGTRLKSIFPDIPKILVPINGVPFLEILFKQFEEFGSISKIILSLGYKAEEIKNFVIGKTTKYPFQIDFSIEDAPLGTGGAIKKGLEMVSSNSLTTSTTIKTTATDKTSLSACFCVSPSISDIHATADDYSDDNDVLVMNGDIFLTYSLKDFIKTHREKKADLTIACLEMQNVDRYGIINIDKNGKIIDFLEKQPIDKGFINCGIYMMKKRLFQKIDKTSFSFEKEAMPIFLQENQVYSHIAKGFFIDIGTESSYYEAQTLLKDFTISFTAKHNNNANKHCHNTKNNSSNFKMDYSS